MPGVIYLLRNNEHCCKYDPILFYLLILEMSLTPAVLSVLGNRIIMLSIGLLKNTIRKNPRFVL